MNRPGFFRLFSAVFALGLTLFCGGCVSSLISMLSGGDKKSEGYRAAPPQIGWEALDPAEADAAYREKTSGAVLTINSVCGDDRLHPLEDLTTGLLEQLPQHKITEPSRARTIAGNPALLTQAKGVVDGEPLTARIVVIRTATCVYDFILAGKKLDESSLTAFESVLSDFHEEKP